MENFFLFKEIDLVHSIHDKLQILTFMTVLWFILYAVVHFLYQDKRVKMKELLDTRNRIVSIIHGVTSFIMAAFAFENNQFNQLNSEYINFICLFSISYVVYDMIACLYYGLYDVGLVIHHSLCILGFGSAILTNYGGVDSIGGLFVAEISNFPMHLRVILRTYGHRYTKSYEICENLYLILYIFWRGIFCPFSVLWPSLNSVHSPIMVKIICFSITFQSFYYILQMSKIIRRKIAQYKQIKEKNISYQWFGQSQDLKKLSFYKNSDGPKIF